MVEVVSVYAPRPKHPKFRDYVTGLGFQRDTAKHWGYRHKLVTDAKVPGFDTLHVELPESLMHAQLVGQIAYLEQWSNDHHVLLVDADCLIVRDLTEAFAPAFDLGLTWRGNPNCMINNGVMYVQAGAKERVLQFFRQALTLCEEHWGGDQEAISMAAAPVPTIDNAEGIRQGALIRFLSMLHYNCVPQREGVAHYKSKPYVVHFKGENRKDWMRTYAENFVLGGTSA